MLSQYWKQRLELRKAREAYRRQGTEQTRDAYKAAQLNADPTRWEATLGVPQRGVTMREGLLVAFAGHHRLDGGLGYLWHVAHHLQPGLALDEDGMLHDTSCGLTICRLGVSYSAVVRCRPELVVLAAAVQVAVASASAAASGMAEKRYEAPMLEAITALEKAAGHSS